MTGTRVFYFTIYLLAVNSVTAQGIEYQLINQMFQTETDTIKLNKEFKSILPDLDYLQCFQKENLQEIWGPHIQTSNEWPSLDTFLTHMDITSFLDFAKKELKIGFQENIDTSKLSSYIEILAIERKPIKHGDGYFVISRPYLNCNQDWAMISVSSVFFGGASGDTIHIYQKIGYKWILFHKIQLNII